ncbi:protein of unknown function [Tenacibaculum sp. 190130A14a]
MLHIQLLVESTFPEVVMQYKWKIPVYYLNGKQLCYLNASHKKGYVDVGFWAKNLLDDYNAHLVSEKRTVVKSLRYTSVEEIDEKILIEVLQVIGL